MIDSRDFAQLLTQIETRIREAAMLALAEGAAMVAEEAKAMLGHEHAEWPPLAPSTEGSADSPLLGTGKMRDSIQFQVEGLSAIVGSDSVEAVAHEHGNAHVPPRPFLSTSAIKKAPEIVELLATRLRSALKE